jgi:hypothetical protein
MKLMCVAVVAEGGVMFMVLDVVLKAEWWLQC